MLRIMEACERTPIRTCLMSSNTNDKVIESNGIKVVYASDLERHLRDFR